MRGQTSPVVSLWRGFFCGRGATLVAARETQRLPALRGSNQRAAAPATPMQKGVPDLWSYPLSDSVDRVGSGLSMHARASPGALAVEDNQSSRRLVLLEPETTAGQPAPVSAKVP